MLSELNLTFPSEHAVLVTLDRHGTSRPLPFANPFTARDHQDLRWYVETYGANSLGDPDDKEALRIAARLPVLGRALFQAAFCFDEAFARFWEFRKREEGTRLFTISAESTAILALPWELIHGPGDPSVPLFLENPRISVRRRVLGAGDGRAPQESQPKPNLRLLFVVSRPDDAGFLDPRADTLPVLDAIDAQAPGRVIYEFLRPPTLDALLTRLDDTSRPAVDVLHFDGHGVFDSHGGLPRRFNDARTRRNARIDEFLRVERHERVAAPPDPDTPPNTGYLLFENGEHKTDLVAAGKLGDNLHRRQLALVILSACQSAAIGIADNDVMSCPFSSVAARLTAAGIPSVLALTHATLVHTTRALFGEFYKELARQQHIGVALDNARRYLKNHPDRYEVQREDGRVALKLHDWFIPVLYQPGADGPLLAAPRARPRRARSAARADSDVPIAASARRSNVPPAPEAGFFGRKHVLWDIERWFAGTTRRITLTGFGGQGKTAVAQEIGRWLVRTGMFAAAVFVDYAQIPSSDAVAVAVSTIGAVFDASLLDTAAATKVLRRTPTLVILDNLEALPAAALRTLLDAAVPWSEARGSRVLCTTRAPDLDHAAYGSAGTRVHQQIQLTGLGTRDAPDAALEWFAALSRLPPAPRYLATREALIELFDQVKFHPLSIRVLAQQLKSRRIAELGERLETLLSAEAAHDDGNTPAVLRASLQLSLDRLGEAARRMLPRLSIFQGGAFESNLVAITGRGESGSSERRAGSVTIAPLDDASAVLRPMRFADVKPPPDATPAPKRFADIWPQLRQQLLDVALIEAEMVPGVGIPFLRFHPTLAPMLWAKLHDDERSWLNIAYRRQYDTLSGALYHEDPRRPDQVRAVARRELPNLLHAVHASLDAGEPDALSFATTVNRFLHCFGRTQEAKELTMKVQGAASDDPRERYIAKSNQGEQLLSEGRAAEGLAVFKGLLMRLGDAPSYERAVTLCNLARCFDTLGQLAPAMREVVAAIDVCLALPPSNHVKKLHSTLLSDWADILVTRKQYGEAREHYAAALALDEEIADLPGQSVILFQLGTLALLEGDLIEAAERFRADRELSHRLGEQMHEASALHMLGQIYEMEMEWDKAEEHYREAAHIKLELGIIAGPNGASGTWASLGNLNSLTGKPQAAESWYLKAIRATVELSLEQSGYLHNLATLLHTQPGRLAEARQFAERARAIRETLDPVAGEIWTTYAILAEIADKEAAAFEDATRKAALQDEARMHRRAARDARRAFAGTRLELQQRLPWILDTIAAVQDVDKRPMLENARLPTLERLGWTKLAAALRRLIAGERHADLLCEHLDIEDSMIIEAIVRGLADPSTLSDLLPRESEESPQDA
jgi:tetratricopeptide (TPR) repeat protein